MHTHLTLHQLMEWCSNVGASIAIHPDGTLYVASGDNIRGTQQAPDKLAISVLSHPSTPRPAAVTLDAAGYESLALVLSAAFAQASAGKGRDRHANNLPFHHQPMQRRADAFGRGGMLFQAMKKMEESQRLPHAAAVNELLGAIVYLAGAVIHMEANQPQAANDNDARAVANHRHG